MRRLTLMIGGVILAMCCPIFAAKKSKNKFKSSYNYGKPKPAEAHEENTLPWLHSKKDAEFQSYYLNIEHLTNELDFDRYEAVLLQAEFLKLLRNSDTQEELKNIDKNEREEKDALLEKIFQEARSKEFNPTRPISGIQKDEFIIVLDLDEVVLRQWHNSPEEALDLPTESVTNTTDDNYQFPAYDHKRIYRHSSETIYLRHGLATFLEELSHLSQFRGFVLFSAKRNLAVQEFFQTLKSKYPQYAYLFLAAYSRDHLIYDPEEKRAMKDPTIFFNGETNYFTVDDGRSRILDKSKLIQIPKFDEAIEAKMDKLYLWRHDEASKRSAIALSEQALPYLATNIQQKLNNPLFKTSNLAFGLGNTGRYIDGLRSYLRAFSARTSQLDTETDWTIQDLVFSPEWQGEVIETLNLRPKYENRWTYNRYSSNFFGFK